MAELKTFLFTDIVGSVELKARMPGRSDAERDAAFVELVLKPHRGRIERELARLGGRLVSTAGDGNFLVFSDTISAAQWAVAIQESHLREPIQVAGAAPVGVRISIHLGLPQIDPNDPNNFVGKPVDYAARLCDYATGGQILASRSVVAILEDAGIDGVSFHRHGQRELRGIGRVDLYELVYDGRGPRKMRAEPRAEVPREWTVLAPTMGLTEFEESTGRESGSLARGSQAEESARGRAGSSANRPAAKGEFSPHGPDGAAPDEPPGPMTDVVPFRLGNYELEDRLGSGGMGDVYRARHMQFGRVRAVKVIKQHYVDSGHREVIRRFYQEIKAVGALEHPNIVVAIDSSAPSDTIHYLVMEYIDGIGADQLVARLGPVTVAEACEIARQAARGLAYINQNGMVHRDLKPSNLMLTVVRADELTGSVALEESGEDQAVVKILDLGLALLVGDDQQRLTLFDNRAMGTAMYMSPEQWKTTSVDTRADIYSLGCTLYHLLAGKPPFWESDLRPEKAHEREALPPITRQDIPAPLWDILKKMTAKDRDERFGDPSEVIAALAPLAEGHHLAELVKSASRGGPSDRTLGFAKGDTRVAKSAETETHRSSPSRRLAKSFPPHSRKLARQVTGWALLIGAIATIVWLATQATGRRELLAESRQRLLQVAADSAAKEIAREMDQRFRLLQRLADDATIRQALVEIDETTDRAERERLWPPLQHRLGDEKQEGDQQAASESWFIIDRLGTQVARSPRGESIGHNYAYRDYFHGRGSDLPHGDEQEVTGDILPITGPHLSAVYESTSDDTLRVAFSVPITNGRRGQDREMIGVAAMSVDLGEFNVLENVLDRRQGQEVVLVDMEDDYLDGEPHRGLILHHNRTDAFGKGEPARRLDSQLLAEISRILTARQKSGKNGDGAPSGTSRNLLIDYTDPLSADGRRKYWGAVEPVIIRMQSGADLDTGWIVIVQEPMSEL